MDAPHRHRDAPQERTTPSVRCPLAFANLVVMVLTEERGRGRFLVLRRGVMIALILTFGLLSQIVALATVFGLAGPAFALAALVVVNATAQIVVGVRHKRRAGEHGVLDWVLRSLGQVLTLVGGLVAIGLGHRDAGWWAAIVYLLWTGGETVMKSRRHEVVPHRESRRSVERRRADVEARVQQADAAIELSESVMVGSPDDEDTQAAAQQLRLAATRARQGALEALRATRSPELQIQAYNRARLRAALGDLDRGPRVGHDDRKTQPSDPWDIGVSDRWNS
jgi:hypothetical protein